VSEPLLALATSAPDRPAVSFPDGSLTYGELRAAAEQLSQRLVGLDRVAVWATPRRHTCIAVCAALLAGVPLVPLDPSAGDSALAHVLSDSDPSVVLADPDDALPDVVRPRVRPLSEPPRHPRTHIPHSVAMILYTSGTTGRPKGVLLPRQALASNLDALANTWTWTPDDVVVQALPLFHRYGLLVGMIGPLRRGGGLIHAGRFAPEALARALDE
jgi:malonyl-CoA/methylmalonyl-CoA synthetase